MIKKIISYFITFFVVLLVLVGCTRLIAGPEGPSGQDGKDATSDVKVFDANGTFLGYSIESSYAGLQLINNTGYYYMLNWNGTIQERWVYFTELNGGGTPVIISEPFTPIYGKIVYYANDIYYIPKDVSPDGTAAFNYSINSTKSRWDSGLQDYYNDNFIFTPTEDVAVELVTTTRSAAGIPITIVPPLQFDFQR